MPSSTSSFERPVPDGNWRGAWLVAVALVIGSTWWLERTTRAHHQHPSVEDDAVWWAMHRADADQPNAVVFLGTSRMQVAYSAEAFTEAAPGYRGVPLAINGTPAFGPLEDLADDADFRGVVVVDMAEWELARADAFTAAKAYIARSHALWRAPGAVANRYLASHAQSHLAVLSVGGRELIASVVGQRRWPDAKWVYGDRDRTFHGDFALADAAAMKKRRDKGLHTFDNKPMEPQRWREQIPRVEAAVQKIRAHGGEVVFVRMPITGQLGELAEQNYPRAMYWDELVRGTSGKTIHFRDVPALAKLECADSMHLDQRDQRAFMQALVEAIRARGLLTGP